jgi:hypothetical protein
MDAREIAKEVASSEASNGSATAIIAIATTGVLNEQSI